MTGQAETPASIRGGVRVLGWLLAGYEPVAFAIVAAGAFNAIAVRGTPVVLILAARLATTALSVAAGRALLDRRPIAPALARLALAGSAAVQVFAQVTPYFPSNRYPGQTPLYVSSTIIYYGAWFLYVWRSKRVAALFD